MQCDGSRVSFCSSDSYLELSPCDTQVKLISAHSLFDVNGPTTLEKDTTILWKALATLFVFISFGVVFYSLTEDWSFVDSLYFVVVTMTTVGYGDLNPTKTGTKVFTLFYILGSVIMIGIAISLVGNFALNAQEDTVKEGYRRFKKSYRQKRAAERQGEIANSTERDTPNRLQTEAQPDGDIFPWTAFVIPTVLYCVGSITFGFILDLDPLNSLYFTMTTVSTVGYGDITPNTNKAKIFTVLYMFLSTIAVAKLANDLAAYFQKKKRIVFLEFLMNSHKGEDELQAMDLDGDGRIDRIEWLTHALVVSESIDRRTIDKIMARFDSLDIDGDGYVLAKDVKQFQARRHSVFGLQVSSPSTHEAPATMISGTGRKPKRTSVQGKGSEKVTYETLDGEEEAEEVSQQETQTSGEAVTSSHATLEVSTEEANEPRLSTAFASTEDQSLPRPSGATAAVMPGEV